MYELGLRHTTGKLTLQLGERERLPFDISAIRTIKFKRTPKGLVDARRELVKSLALGLAAGGDPVTATRVWFEIMPPPAPTIESLEPTENEESGFLEKLADTEDGMQSLLVALGNSAAISQEISRLMRETTAHVNNLEANGRYSSAKLAAANRLASLLDDPASRLEVSAGDYSQSIQRMEPGIVYILERLAQDSGEMASAPEFPSQIHTLVKAAEESVEITIGFKQSMESMGEAARSLRTVGRRIGTSLQSIANSSKRVASWRPAVERVLARLPTSKFE